MYQKAGLGTHPTRMHSCFWIYFGIVLKCKVTYLPIYASRMSIRRLRKSNSVLVTNSLATTWSNINKKNTAHNNLTETMVVGYTRFHSVFFTHLMLFELCLESTRYLYTVRNVCFTYHYLPSVAMTFTVILNTLFT